MTPVRDEHGNVIALPEVEHVLVGCLDALRDARSDLPGADSLEWNRIMLYVWPVVDLPPEAFDAVARRLAPLTEGLGLEQVVVSGSLASGGSDPVEAVVRIGYEPGRGVTVRLTEPPDRGDAAARRLHPQARPDAPPRADLSVRADPDAVWCRRVVRRARSRRVRRARRRSIVLPVATPRASWWAWCPPRPIGTPRASTRVAVLGDPTKAMGSIAEPECVRLLAAIDLAVELDVPIEWFALSAGAKIAMDSGSENLDWVARVLRRLVEHTQRGGEVNVVVAGINVGAQPYWNAEATMLMHTKGILVMTPDSAMVLTGKQAIEYSGGVAAEDNLGIGGYERIMGPNGEAQYWAPTLTAACELLHRHYELTLSSAGRALAAAGSRRPIRSIGTCAPNPMWSTGSTSAPSATSSRPMPTPTARSRSTSAR